VQGIFTSTCSHSVAHSGPLILTHFEKLSIIWNDKQYKGETAYHIYPDGPNINATFCQILFNIIIPTSRHFKRDYFLRLKSIAMLHSPVYTTHVPTHLFTPPSALTTTHTILDTRWFKYDRDDLCVNKSQFVPVIFGSTLCIYLSHLQW
jgi:hypothetical protein